MKTANTSAKSRRKRLSAQKSAFPFALKNENLRLQKQLVRLQAEQVSLGNRIRVLEDELRKEKSLPKVRDLMAEIAKRDREQPAPNTDARHEAGARRVAPR